MRIFAWTNHLQRSLNQQISLACAQFKGGAHTLCRLIQNLIKRGAYKPHPIAKVNSLGPKLYNCTWSVLPGLPQR